jgi:hypothetical protein
VQVDSFPASTVEPVWLRLVHLYKNNESPVATLDSDHKCTFYDLEIGSYLAILQNSTGILGASRIRVDDPNGHVRIHAGEALNPVGLTK